jgi:hypothetical protein
MKWIGQHIWSLISRFRNDVYLEDVSSGTIASGGNLGLDTNNKIVKATETTGDITGVTITTDSGGGSAASDTAGSADFTILGTSGIGVTNSGADITVTSVPGEIDHDSLNNFVDDEHFTQANITTVGTIGTGVWQGDAIAVTYTAAKVTSVIAGNGIDVDSATGDVTVTAEAASDSNPGVVELATTAETTTGTDAARAVTPDGLKDGYQGSTNVTTLGTIATGTWNGSVIGSAYLDADTAHYSAQKQLTYYMFRADVDTTKTYVGLQEADGESSTSTNKNLPILAPVAGKLLKVFLRGTTDLSGVTLTWRLETQRAGANTGAAPTIVGTQSGAGCTTQTMTTYDFTESLDSGDNIIDAGDTVQLSIQSDGATTNTTYYVTCLWEWNLS